MAEAAPISVGRVERCICFFFSSRRRHTRCLSNWSSDVCSSDLNFQSWLDPFIILTALTGALAGVIWGLFVTGTTLSVPAMMGAIMCMGVATANSILVVAFANERLTEHGDPLQAAIEAGFTRFRPVLMTA